MRYGGTLPWARQGRILTRCPDPYGALWQLRMAGETPAAGAEREKTAAAPDGYQLQSCRGLQGTCPFALVNDPLLARRVDDAIRGSAWWQRQSSRNGQPLPHHLRLRVALAACPNACTMPQIRDIGIIATRMPQAIRPECDGCGRCTQACREGATTIGSGRAEWHKDRCVGCGQCLGHCPTRAMESGPVRLRILVGGRMGRHPRWARDLCEVDPASAADVVKSILDRLAREVPPAGRITDTVERIWTTI